MTKQPEQSKRPNPLVSISTMASLMANGVQVHDWGELTCWLQMLTTGLQEGDSFDWAVHEARGPSSLMPGRLGLAQRPRG